MRFQMTIAAALLVSLALPAIVLGADPAAPIRDDRRRLRGAARRHRCRRHRLGGDQPGRHDDHLSRRVRRAVRRAGRRSHPHGRSGCLRRGHLPAHREREPHGRDVDPADFTASGSVTTFAEAVSAIKAGTTYVNLHTAANPGGEIRGDLITVVDAFEAALDGAQEVPPVATAATGVGLVVFSADDATIWYRVDYSGLSGAPAAAHIHLGDLGANGGVLFPLSATASPMLGSLTSADFTATGSVADYAGAVAAIKAGGTYVNVHTGANPGGEVRGQIGAAPAPTATTPPTSTVDGYGESPSRRSSRSGGAARPRARGCRDRASTGGSAGLSGQSTYADPGGASVGRAVGPPHTRVRDGQPQNRRTASYRTGRPQRRAWSEIRSSIPWKRSK